MKTYVLTVSRFFPKTHKRAGEKTNFSQKLQLGIKNIPNSVMYDEECDLIMDRKIHTIRANYPLWKKRISEIQNGNAILSIRYWSGKPYKSKQVEITQLDKNSGVGVQELVYGYDKTLIKELAMNDGLSLEDFQEWFKKYDLSKPLAIIHFTRFRY